MPRLTGPCVIAICRKASTQWRRVSESFLSKAHSNRTLPSYLQLGDTVCSNCYNGIAVNSSIEFRQHSEEIRSVEAEIEVEDTNSILSFSQARVIDEYFIRARG